MSITADQHVHSHHSADSEERMERIAEQAIAAGLRDLCFTEHNDFDYPDVGDEEIKKTTFYLDTDAYHEEYLSVRERYADRIRLHFGVELGLQPHLAEENRAFVQAKPYDLVIASIHVSRGRDPYYPAFYEGRTEEEAMREILEETLENIRVFDDFDVLGHLDYILRYVPSGRQTMDMDPFSDLLDEILALLIRRGQGLDLNSQPIWKKGYPEMNPSRQILLRYRALGGRIITFGSDAHRAANVAGGFDRAAALARACGFDGYAVYSGRSGQMRPL
ncbi:MAG: histidinol-phosphatase HisJ family protein [Lachnospiraceae bacterium]|nr:histidinol-phosphatase HisJ family protein [Lachnospiraceae bacterium]